MYQMHIYASYASKVMHMSKECKDEKSMLELLETSVYSSKSKRIDNHFLLFSH